VISADIAADNAVRLGHSLNDELKVLALHGLLHLSGYDHETDNGKMARREARLRKELGLPVSLIERTSAHAGLAKELGKAKLLIRASNPKANKPNNAVERSGNPRRPRIRPGSKIAPKRVRTRAGV
jgi:hypothetical protein